MKFCIQVLVGLLFASIVFASESHSAHGEAGEIPKVVLFQAINVAIIMIAAIYLGRKKVVKYFEDKRALFIAAQEKAQGILKTAQQEHHEVKTRLDKLKITRAESLSKAKADANDIRSKIIEEAKMMAKKLREEAVLSSKIEIERAKIHLRDQLIKEAFDLSKRDLATKATQADQKKLQDDFISKVKVGL